MDNDLPLGNAAGGEEETQQYGYQRRGVNTWLIVAIGVFAVLSFYVSLIVATRVDAVIFPGQNLGLPSVTLPGVGDVSKVVPADDSPGARINILVMGLDQRLDQPDHNAYRTDSVVVFTLDPATKTGGALSIPRDTMVDIPDGNGGVYMRTRINEAYEMGEFGVNGFPDGYDGGGPKLLEDTIQKNFGIKIDHYVVLNWQNFIQIIDQLGGIDINVPEYVYDPAYTTCEFCNDYHPVEFDPGPQHMDGETALEYARLRHSDNDFKRIERQQLVMRAVAAKAASLDWISVSKAKDLYSTYKGSIDTDVPDLLAPGLATLANQIGLSNIKMVSAAPATYSCQLNSDCPGGAAVLDWNPTKMQQIIAQVFANQQVVTESAQITVLNGTQTPNLASSLSGELAISGISSDEVKVDEYANGLLWPSTLIIDASGTKPQTLSQLKSLLNLTDAGVVKPADVPTLYPDLEQFLGTTADLVVVLGADAQFSGIGDVSVAPSSSDSSSSDDNTQDYTTPDATQPDFSTPTDEPVITDAPVETDTPEPTDTPIDTDTPAPTDPPADGG